MKVKDNKKASKLIIRPIGHTKNMFLIFSRKMVNKKGKKSKGFGRKEQRKKTVIALQIKRGINSTDMVKRLTVVYDFCQPNKMESVVISLRTNLNVKF